MTGGGALGECRGMSELPRSERERDLVRELVELVGGAPRRSSPPPTAEPAPPAAAAPHEPTDEETTP